MPGVTTLVSVKPVVAFVTFVFQPNLFKVSANAFASTKPVLLVPSSALPSITSTLPSFGVKVTVSPSAFTESKSSSAETSLKLIPPVWLNFCVSVAVSFLTFAPFTSFLALSLMVLSVAALTS